MIMDGAEVQAQRVLVSVTTYGEWICNGLYNSCMSPVNLQCSYAHMLCAVRMLYQFCTCSVQAFVHCTLDIITPCVYDYV